MVNEKLISSMRTIERALGKIEGIAFTLDDKHANPLFDAIELIEIAVKEITDAK